MNFDNVCRCRPGGHPPGWLCPVCLAKRKRIVEARKAWMDDPTQPFPETTGTAPKGQP